MIGSRSFPILHDLWGNLLRVFENHSLKRVRNRCVYRIHVRANDLQASVFRHFLEVHHRNTPDSAFTITRQLQLGVSHILHLPKISGHVTFI